MNPVSSSEISPTNAEIKTKVFMVDNTKSICLQVEKLFAREDIEFKYCLYAAHAITEITAYEPSVIIQDLYMRDKDGFDLLAEYKANASIKNIPILIFSDERNEEAKNRAFFLGADDFLSKNENKQELIARVLYHSNRFLNSCHCQETFLTDSLLSDRQNLIKVLMIDTSKFSCFIMQKILSQENSITFKYCLDVTNAIREIENYRPSVILLKLYDVNNEQFFLIRKIRENLRIRDIPIIIYSSFADNELKIKSLAAGADDYIAKSTDDSDHIELVNTIIAHSQRCFNLPKLRALTKFSHLDTTVTPVRLLMIDDSEFICEWVKELLSCEPTIHIAFCNDSTLALELTKEYNPTIVLMDLEMPNISGLELLALFKMDEFVQEVPVIFLSGVSDPEVKAKAFALGANDYMEKDMDVVEIISRIKFHSHSYLTSIRLSNSIQELINMQQLLKSQSAFIRKTFGRYLSEEVVHNILKSPQGMTLGGESRTMSIMMSDLRGFTSLAERLPAETVLAIINNYLSVMTDILLKYNGTIDEFIGDAILAIFGAPIQRHDDAKRAVACAIEMQLAMEKVNAWNHKQGYPEVAMGIGINTGEAVVGNIGSEKRVKYGIVGRNVNLTSRIESYTTAGQIFVSESTVKKCGDILRIDSEMEVMPKGVKNAITIYDIGGIADEFNLYLPPKKLPSFMRLDPPLKINFAVVEGKHAGDRNYYAELTKISLKGMKIKSSFIVDKLNNIKVCLFDYQQQIVCDDLYAKVNYIDADGFVVLFTSIPPEAESFFNSLLAIPNQ
jgi:adenylate cyclase